MSFLWSCQGLLRISRSNILLFNFTGKKYHVTTVNFSDEYKAAQEKRIQSLEKNHAVFKHDVAEYKQSVIDKTENWKKQNEIYYGKDRDFENFPILKQPEYHPPVRMGFLPDSWFRALYDKTGVTGPYLFLFGGMSFLLSKEYWVMDHEFFEVPAFFIVVAIFYRKLGPIMKKYLTARREKFYWAIFDRPMERMRQETKSRIDHCNQIIQQIDATPIYYQIARENVALQLEAAYRQRLQEASRVVTQQLQYHVDRDRAARQFKRRHMVNWLVSSVENSVTPTLEKEAFRQCLTDLSVLSKQYRSATDVAV